MSQKGVITSLAFIVVARLPCMIVQDHGQLSTNCYTCCSLISASCTASTARTFRCNEWPVPSLLCVALMACFMTKHGHHKPCG